jgi:transposase
MMSRLSKHNTKLTESRPFVGMSQVHANAAGVDIGAHEIMVCISGPDNTQIVRSFGNYTVDLYAIADWFREHNIETVAMESTGVYWIPLFEVLESCVFQCCLISSRSLRRVPGRKSDVIDCQWIQTLHSYGLLESSFRPEADLVALRTLLRHRDQLIQHRAPHILHMQKAMLQMNIQLSQVLSDVTGETGQAIIRAIVAGERNPEQLAALRNFRCKKSQEEIGKALMGTWREEHLFVLEQSLALYDFYTMQMNACDAEIERIYQLTRPDWSPGEPIETSPAPGKRESRGKNAPDEKRVAAHLQRICGVNPAAIHGMNASLAQKIVIETGTTMQPFPTEKHFCSWLGLAPKHEITGGKVQKNSTQKTHNRAGQAFRMAANALTRSNCVFGVYYRRMKARLGAAQANVATAHKIACVFYHMLKFKVPYQPLSIPDYEAQFREKQIKYLAQKAAKLGFYITPSQAVS